VRDAATEAPGPPDGASIRHFLSGVLQALSLPEPLGGRGRLRYLRLLEKRSRIARASILRILDSPDIDELDLMSEGDHILHQIAELPADYRHRLAEQ
jgi:hypothetical protein